MYIAAQIVGIVGVITFLLSYQLKKRENIIRMNAFSSCLYVLQYIMLGAFEGAAIDILSAVSTVAAHRKEFLGKYKVVVIAVMNLAIFAAGLMLYKNIFSLFPVAGAILQTSAFWLTDEKRIRQVSFFGSPFWLIYNLTSHAYGSSIGSALSIASIGLAIYRYDILTKRKKEFKY